MIDLGKFQWGSQNYLVMTALHISSALPRIAFWSFFIFITYKFLAPSTHSGIEIPHLDKLAHFVVFALLSGLVHFGYQLNDKMQLLTWTIYGAGIEFLQGLTPARSPEVLDFVADMLGVIVALVLVKKLPIITIDKNSEKADE